MLVDFNFMACGEAGQGVQSIGWVFAKTMSYGGFHVFADQDYENRVRGGHNFFRVRVSDKKVLTFAEKLDILIALHEDAVTLHKKDIKENGVIIFDRETTHIEGESDLYLHVPLSQLAEETTNNTFMVNTVALGAAFGLTGCDFEILKTVLQKEFQKAGEEIVKKNMAAVRAGFEFTFQKGIHKVYQKTQPERNPPKRMFLNGNEALALGAMVGGCKFICVSLMKMSPLIAVLKCPYYGKGHYSNESERAAEVLSLKDGNRW